MALKATDNDLEKHTHWHHYDDDRSTISGSSASGSEDWGLSEEQLVYYICICLYHAVYAIAINEC